MKKNIIITVLVTSIILFTILAIVGMNMEDEVAPTQTTTNITANLKSNFVTECTGESASYAYCSCVFEDLIINYGENDFIRMSVKYDEDGILPDKVLESAKKCMHLN